MNILIANAEYENIKNMQKYILKNYKLNCNVFFINSQGVDIIENIGKNSIDLILLDIRFYGAYTYKSVKEILNKYPNMLFVYSGMISDIAYINKCMELSGIFTMYRPIKPADIILALKTAQEVLQKQKIKLNLIQELRNIVLGTKVCLKISF